MKILCLIGPILDNTFLGTLLAGVLLALFGFYLYRKQKEIDSNHKDLEVLREQSASLFSEIELASKDYQGQINIYSDNNLENIKNLYKQNNYLNDHQINEIIKASQRVKKTADKLLSNPIIYSFKSEAEIKIITNNIPTIIMYLNMVSVLKDTSKEDLERYKIHFDNVISEVKDFLQKVIKQKTA